MTKFNSRQQYNQITQSFSKIFDIKLSKVRHKMSTEEGFKDVNAHMASLPECIKNESLNNDDISLYGFFPFANYTKGEIDYNDLNLMLIRNFETAKFEKIMTKFNIKKDVSMGAFQYYFYRTSHGLTIDYNVFLIEGEINLSSGIFNESTNDYAFVRDNIFINYSDDDDDEGDESFYNSRTLESNCLFNEEQSLFINETLFIFKQLFSNLINVSIKEDFDYKEVENFSNSIKFISKENNCNFTIKCHNDLIFKQDDLLIEFNNFLISKNTIYKCKLNTSFNKFDENFDFYAIEINNAIKFFPVSI
jgi:hypothetical protein